MIQVDLVWLAEILRTRGCEACHEIVAGPHGWQEGLDIGEDFFPLWELNLPENQEALRKFDFQEIKSRRGPNWSVAPPAVGVH
jgi:hypothetical protein